MIRSMKLSILLIIILGSISCNQDYKRIVINNQKLWFDKPAETWHAALPLGNGKLGALIHGNIQSEIINLNEESLVAGQSYFKEMPQMQPSLAKIRQLWFDGKYLEAEELAKKTMCIPNDDRYGHYKPLGDLLIDFEGLEGDVSGYIRELSLDSAFTSVRFSINSVKHKRTAFISYPDQVMVFKYESDRPANLNARISFHRKENIQTSTHGNDVLNINGQCDFGGTKFNAKVKVLTKTGTVSAEHDALIIQNADEFELRVICKTDYWGDENYPQLSDQIMEENSQKSFQSLLRSHLDDYHANFSRVNLSLPKTEISNAPVNKRLDRIIQNPDNLLSDPDFVSLYFTYGRYLLYSSSRPGCLPANLRGIWNPEYYPGWFSDYTLNINVEMNYWLGQSCNLSECVQPLFYILEKSRSWGRRAAKHRYGADGFVLSSRMTAHVTSEMRSGNFGWFQDGHAWIAQAYWQHYLYTLDREFLRNRAYPMFKEIAEFYLDILIEHPKYGWLVSGPSQSPENAYIVPGYEDHVSSVLDEKDETIFNTGSQSKTASTGMGNTISNQLIRDIFNECIEAATILDIDAEFREVLMQKRDKLAPTRIGADGTIMEWLEDFHEADPSHRHISHLYGLAPSNQISLRSTPDLAKAAYKTLEKKLADGKLRPSWSWAWFVNCWARLGEGDNGLDALANSLATTTFPNLLSKEYANNKYEFIIDGILGATAGIAEMFLQSHVGEIDLLPALPTVFSKGNIQGLKAQGGFVLDIEWENGGLKKVTVFSTNGSLCKLRYKDKIVEFTTDVNKNYILNSNLEI